MQGIIGILQGATFTETPELRSGEELYWHGLAQQYIALPRPSPQDDQVLRQNGWQQKTPEQAKQDTFTPLTGLRRLWPDLHSPNPDLYAHKLSDNTCKMLIAAQPEDQRGRMARWLMARCKALHKNDLVATISNYMVELNVAADHPWATSQAQPEQFLLSPDRGSAFLLTGSERVGYTLHSFIKGDSAPRERHGETIRDLLAPNAEWAGADWGCYAALLQAKPAEPDDFWEHPALSSFIGVRHSLVEGLSSYTHAQWAEYVRNEGAGGLLGGQHVTLQRRFMSAPPASWLDYMADDLGLTLDSQPAYRMLTDAWMALRASDSECRDFILPAIREAHPEALGEKSDDDLLALWRGCYQGITDNIRQKATAPGSRTLIRTSPAFTDMTPASMREVLSAHFGEPAINALEQAGKLNLLSRADDLPALIRGSTASVRNSVAGVTTADSTVYLIGNRINPQTLPGLFLHEVGEHAGLAQMLGPDYGRMSAHFNRLLRDKDSYATWAAMRVPASTAPEHVPSEQLAYLIERVANDSQAQAGGEKGYELGQECLANLRTWLFRTPLCRWLDEIGALESFTLRPQDMASMAREAVDFFVEQSVPGTISTNRNNWLEELSPEQLDTLYRADPQERISALARETPERTLGYLYALAMTNAPMIHTAVDHFAPTLTTMAAGQGKPEFVAIAAELLAQGRQLDTQAQLQAQYDRAGFAMWVDAADTPAEARMSFLVPSPKHPGQWQLNYYRKDVGAYDDEQFGSVEEAIARASASSFIVSDVEASTVLQSWANVPAANDQVASKSFARWFGNSQAVSDSGQPLTMYHGTGKDFTEFKGTTIWASSTPALANEYAEYRGEWQDDANANVMPVYLKAERPFDADKLEKTVTLSSFFKEAAEQCVAAGRTFDSEQAVTMLNHLRACARREESGPHYRNYDIWNEASSMFGRDGADTVRALFKLFGYDSIKITEREQLTIGVFEPTQVKSAIGNRGTYSDQVNDIRMAEVTALQRWAGNSKVVDSKGQLLVVYHGSVVRQSDVAPWMGDIKEFDRLFTTKFRRPSIDTMGSWFSTNPGDGGAQMYSGTREGSVIYPVFLSIQNPHETTFQLMSRRARLLANGVDDGRMIGKAEVNAYRAWLKEMGKDGIKIVHDSGREHQSTEFKDQTVWVALEPTQIKSAIGNAGTYDPANPDIRFSFAGEHALTANRDLLSQAQARLDAGDNPEVIRQETGWFQGHDQRWRFEIDDSAVKLPEDWYQDGVAQGEPIFRMHSSLGGYTAALHPVAAQQLGRDTMSVPGLIEHPALFSAYPELRQIDVVLERSEGFPFTYSGEFRRSGVEGQPDSILLRFNPARGGSAIRGLLHEVQHAIQKAEGFARGGSPSDFSAEQLIHDELAGINARIRTVMAANPETATVYRTYNQMRIRANDESWPDHLVASVAAVEAELIELPGGSELFDLETERMSVAFIDKVAAPIEKYRRLAGEVEARNVEARLGMSAQERRETSPLATEDIAPELVDVRMSSASVLKQALEQQEAEQATVNAGALNMSHSARMARAQALGFDTSRVWYHGTEKAGFKEFDTDGKPNSKSSGTGAFFADTMSMAKSYGGSGDDAPIFTGSQLFADPSLLSDLEVERYWAVVNRNGRVTEHSSRDDFDSAEQWLREDGIELDDGDSVEERFTLYYGNDFQETLVSQDEAIAALDALVPAQPGLYSVYLRTKETLEIDWGGANWDSGPTEPAWGLYDEDGDLIDWLYSEAEADAAQAENPGSTIQYSDNQVYESSDHAARMARNMGYDAVLIRNIADTGRYSQHEEGDIMIVFDPANIRTTNAAFDPAQSASGNLMFSVAEAPQSTAFDQWFDGSQVLNDDGTPLVVYRGEHGRGDSDAVFQSRLGSLSFGEYATAAMYATEPNDRRDTPSNPRIIPAYLSIKRPLVVNKGDPFIDFAVLIEAIGAERAAIIAGDLAGYIENTQAWADLNTEMPVAEYLSLHPEALRSLYVELYPILDNTRYVDWLKAAGFDGAIYASSGSGHGTVEYRVFNPEQVASGAPMPVTPQAPGGSTRMALSSQVPLPSSFSGSPLTAQQFTLEQQHLGLPGPFGYGVYLPDAAAAEQLTSASLNRFDGKPLTPATLKQLQGQETLAPGLRQFLWQNAKALAAGSDVQLLLQGQLRKLQDKLAALEGNYSALLRGEARPLSAEQYAGMERVVKTELGSLINAMGRFEHVAAGIAPDAGAQFLMWDRAMAAQPAEVRQALALLGIDGYSEVHGPAGVNSFLSSVEAQAHLARLHKEGLPAKLITDFADDHPAMPRGADVYRELSDLLGGAQGASARLRDTGIHGICYHQASRAGTSPRFVVFEQPAPQLQGGASVRVVEQGGGDKPAFPLALESLPGVMIQGGIASAAPALGMVARKQLSAIDARVAGLEGRQDWLRDLPNASAKVIEQNRVALARSRHEQQALRGWAMPSADNCLPWKSALSIAACIRLSGLIPVKAHEQLTGESVFHLLAERHGGNRAAIQALTKAGFVGAETGSQLLLWDKASQTLAGELTNNEDRCRFHLVAHGSKHLIDKFSSEMIGTGEGVQAFGYGLYFADRKMVASHYQKQKVNEGCWYENDFYDSTEAMVSAVAARISREGATEDQVLAAKHCLNVRSWAPHRVEQVVESYPQDYQAALKLLLNGFSKIDPEQVSRFFLMPSNGMRGINDINMNDDRDYSFGLSYLGAGLHYYVREDMSDDQLAKVLADHVAKQCDVGEAMEARHHVLRELEQRPDDDYLQSRLRDCDYYLMMAQCAQKTLEAFGPFRLARPLGAGNLYLVDLTIKPSEYLRFDLPYSEQSSLVQQAFAALTDDPRLTDSKQAALKQAVADNLTGQEVYAALAGRGFYFNAACAEDEILASQLLHEQAVQGIQYPDGLSRNAEGGTFNYVVFNDERVEILGHTDKYLRNEDDEVPLYDWVDPDSVPEPAHRLR